MRLIDLIGSRFSRLTVVARGPKKGSRIYWICHCDCGTSTTVAAGNLRNGAVKSCGCLRRDQSSENFTTHGHSRSEAEPQQQRTYLSWANMRQRCANRNHPRYVDYGGRGITVCGRWLKFENFLADMGESSPGMTIERIDNDGNYAPGNCRWATRREQTRNTRHSRLISWNGVTLCLVDWAERVGIRYQILWDRLKDGWSIERTMTTPIRDRVRMTTMKD